MSGDGSSGLLTLPEYGKLSYETLGEAEAYRLEKATKDFGVPMMFRFFRTHVQAQQYVGMVKAGERTIQVLPKIYEEDSKNLGFLVSMLSYTRRLKLRPVGTADYEKLNGSFLEVWIRHFATELNRLLHRHLMHRYVEVEERTGFLRGKLLVERELSGAGSLYARYACRYEVFTPDHLLNRVLKFCNGLLLKQTRVSANRSLLRKNDLLLSDVDPGIIRPSDLDRINLDRLNRHYEPILRLCRLLLDERTLDLRAGRITQLAFVFDMNRLFEAFVAEFLKRHADKIELGGGRRLEKVEYQHRLGQLFEEFGMDVDLVLTDDNKHSFLVDTKYKVLDTKDRHGGISQADFYQMYAYGRAGKQRYDDIVLLYPTTTAIRRDFRQDKLQLRVRQFDPRAIYDHENGGLNVAAVAKELSQALSDVRFGE